MSPKKFCLRHRRMISKIFFNWMQNLATQKFCCPRRVPSLHLLVKPTSHLTRPSEKIDYFGVGTDGFSETVVSLPLVQIYKKFSANKFISRGRSYTMDETKFWWAHRTPFYDLSSHRNESIIFILSPLIFIESEVTKFEYFQRIYWKQTSLILTLFCPSDCCKFFKCFL